jgi:Amt family ammonium transporter
MTLQALTTALDSGWTLLGAALVFFMQAGFTLVEAGMTRAKNTGNIIMKNLLDFCIGTPAYWFIGFGIMFGTNQVCNGFIGGLNLFCLQSDDFTTMIFQTVFCATAATIVSGAMAERTNFAAYCIYSAIISLVVYPIEGHWIWGGGWLAQLGFHDFAGSTAVHMVGGVAAFVGAAILGPRIGKYTKDGKVNAIPGHNLLQAALGVFILWFAWFGFNGCSTTALSDGAYLSAARIFYTTNMSAAIATVTVLLITWIRYGKPDVSMTLNGSLAGLVGVTAGCDTVTPVGAAIIGIICGFVVVFGIEFVDQKLKVDDPVGAVGVHGCCGCVGSILVGFLAYYDYGLGEKAGLVYGGGFHALGLQLLGVVSVIAWVAVTMVIVFTVLKKTVGLRCSAEAEIEGLDRSEHGLESAYADFALTSSINNFGSHAAAAAAEIERDKALAEGKVPVDEAVPVQLRTADPSVSLGSDVSITKITIYTKQSKYEELNHAMSEIGINGMTVTNVLGCGAQGGRTTKYRGAELNMNLLPKIQVDIVVSKISPRTVIDAAKKVLYTGHIGDGKIFVYNVENAVKISTGAEGYDALQD